MASERQMGGVGYVLRKFPVLSETFILNEILALEALGVPVHVFALAPTRDPRFHEGVARLKATIHYVPGPSDWRTLWRHLGRIRKAQPKEFRSAAWEAVKTLQPTVLWRFVQATYVADRARRYELEHLHAHFANRTATVARFAGRLMGRPYSFTAHAFDIYRGADLGAVKQKMRDAAFTVTVSDYNVAYLRELFEEDDAVPRIELVRNGIDFERFHPADGPAPVERGEAPFTILAVARFVEKKGLPILVDAVKVLTDRGHDVRCHLVGKGNQRGLLERRVRELELKKRVRILPPHTQQEILARFHEADVVALPCLVGEDGNRDGLPVSIVEALACGVPVVSTPVTGIPEAVKDGVNGFIVPERDPEALADALEKLIVDRELHARLRAAARPSVAEEYDQDRTARRLHDLLRESAKAVADGATTSPADAAAPSSSRRRAAG